MYLGGSAHDLISEDINYGDAISSLRTLVSCMSYIISKAKGRRDTEHLLAKIKGVIYQ